VGGDDGSPGVAVVTTAALTFLLSGIYSGALAPEHLADLRKSGLRDDTIQAHRIMSVPPSMIGQLLGFDIAAIRSAMLIPFPDPRGGYMDHVRLKIFPSFQDRRGHTIKYLQPARCEARLYFPWSTLSALDGSAPLWLVEGEKRAWRLPSSVCSLWDSRVLKRGTDAARSTCFPTSARSGCKVAGSNCSPTGT
jgi:hypothetical protein